MRQQKTFWNLLLAVGILGICLLGLQRYNAYLEANKPQKPVYQVVSVPKADVVSFSYDYMKKHYTFEKKDGIWYYTEDETLELDQKRIQKTADKMAALTAEKVMNDVTDLDQYGLIEPKRTFSFQTAEESYEFALGDHNDLTYVYYLQDVSDTETVYAITSSIVTLINMDLNTAQGLTADLLSDQAFEAQESDGFSILE